MRQSCLVVGKDRLALLDERHDGFFVLFGFVRERLKAGGHFEQAVEACVLPFTQQPFG